MNNYILLDNGKKIDLGDVAIPINYYYSGGSIDDFELGDSNDITTAFTVRGTTQINEILKGVSLLHSSIDFPNFDPTIRTPCTLFLNGKEKLKGSMLLIEVTKHRRDIMYKLQVISEMTDLLLNANNFNLSDLDWSDTFHKYTKTNIQNSWSGLTPYFYALANKGLTRPTPRDFTTEEFGLYLYVKDIFDRIMKRLNMPYSSNFLTNDIDELMYGYGGEIPVELNQTEINDREVHYTFEATNNDLQNDGWINNVQRDPSDPDALFFINQTISLISNVSNVNVITDNLMQKQNNTIVIARSGLMKLTWSMQIEMTIVGLNYPATPTIDLNLLVGFRRNGQGLTFLPFLYQGTTAWNGVNKVTFTATGIEVEHYFEANDVIDIAMIINPSSITFASGTPLNFSYTVETEITTADVHLEALSIGLGYNTDIQPFWFLSDMKASDFLKEVKKLFNLEMKMIENELFIEPYKDYYKGTSDIEDWSDKADYSKPMTIVPISNSESKNIIFSVAESEEIDKKDYLAKTQKNYGQRRVEQGSYYAKGTTEITTLTSTIIPVQVPEDGAMVDVITEIRLMDDDKHIKSIPRIGFKKVFQSNNPLATLQDMGENNPTNISEIGAILDFNQNYFSHFTVPEQKYHDLSIPSNNLFSLFQLMKLNEFVGATARKLVCYIKLNELERVMMDVRKFKLIDGSVWRLISIDNFDGNKAVTFKCTFLKVVKFY